jgi:hypothetical protein
MAAQDELRLLRQTREDLEQSCILLQTPSAEALDHCAELLEAACLRAREWNAQLPAFEAVPGAKDEARRLRSSLRRAARLLESAASYHARWGRIVGAMCVGYAPDGGPGTRPAATARRILAEG